MSSSKPDWHLSLRVEPLAAARGLPDWEPGTTLQLLLKIGLGLPQAAKETRSDLVAISIIPNGSWPDPAARHQDRAVRLRLVHRIQDLDLRASHTKLQCLRMRRHPDINMDDALLAVGTHR